MSLLHFLIFLITLGLGFSGFDSGDVIALESPHRRLDADAPCPLNFDALRELVQGSNGIVLTDVSAKCRYVLQGLRLVESLYLQTTGFFLPPLNASESCWESYQSLISEIIPNFDILSSCGFQISWISEGCMNITSRSQFESIVPESSLLEVEHSCKQSLENGSPCASCTTSLSSLQAAYLRGSQVGNVSACTGYPSIYAAGIVNRFGPADKGTAMCLFSLYFSSSAASSNNSPKTLISGIVIGGSVGLLGIIVAFWFVRRRYKKRRRKRKMFVKIPRTNSFEGLELISGSTTLIKFTFDEIKRATRNFSRDNIIGKGGYGNVYEGTLRDGSEAAFKRFKNCSPSGDASFAHELEVIASVRHVNLIALRGYCTATTPFEGHQRIIVCNLMRNGSLHDHLFGSTDNRLSWPIRKKIALGTARGLAYLHYGAQPSIIHRDIKASNILLDEMFEPKLADFGFAKYRPEGMTHLSTRVAGTLGYVAPEYALYGQLTERSDVYSYGVVLLELLSGKKAIGSANDGRTSLVADWAWSLVREGRALDVIEDGMPELGDKEVMEKYVLVAVLSSHPHLYARPTMDQIVKILETDLPVPSIPDRPIPIVAEIGAIKSSVSGSGSGQLSSSGGYQAFLAEGNNSSSEKRKPHYWRSKQQSKMI
ncbi:probable LRR receptor-like serine/threonine-protein kinase RKF3 [Macadamia integrifolia]|uniref:probable LRR receptor-like serine/threonine-protein kinase RKF3 n=1 Tax=Macadamia integrifolia TaxID=60698 RepID=UPI001C4E492E|nr:probable LRR receptor-like serine/threonine-protein kinase RKF3 [Macadamia integrifolia]